MTTPRSRSNKHIDDQKKKQKEQAKQNLRTLLDTGDEDGYVELLKALRPNLKPEELVSLVEQFRAERWNRSRGLDSRP